MKIGERRAASAPLAVPAGGGTLLPVSSTNPLTITIVAGTTFTAQVTGYTPINANFPDGPGELTLSTTLSAAVAVQSYITSPVAPYIIRPNNKASSEGIALTDIPTAQLILNMRSRLMSAGVPMHEDGTFHLHVDESFFPLITQDVTWQRATSNAGVRAIFGIEGYFVPQYGITVFEGNDSPALGKGNEVNVGAVGSSGSGGTGTPGSSVSMQDLGLDVVNSGGTPVRRAILTGGEVMTETYIDEEKYYSEFGIEKLGDINDTMRVYSMNGAMMIEGNIDGWRLNIRPALDDRGISCTFSVSSVFDETLHTDSISTSLASSITPLKRAVVMEYGNPI
jgi:hypothetical protein